MEHNLSTSNNLGAPREHENSLKCSQEPTVFNILYTKLIQSTPSPILFI